MIKYVHDMHVAIGRKRGTYRELANYERLMCTIQKQANIQHTFTTSSPCVSVAGVHSYISKDRSILDSVMEDLELVLWILGWRWKNTLDGTAVHGRVPCITKTHTFNWLGPVQPGGTVRVNLKNLVKVHPEMWGISYGVEDYIELRVKLRTVELRQSRMTCCATKPLQESIRDENHQGSTQTIFSQQLASNSICDAIL